MRPADTIRIARAVGCRVIEVSDEGDAPRVELDCASGWDAARLLLALGREDASDPAVRALAVRLGTPRAAHDWVARHVRFVREPGEIFQGAAVTMAKGEGDCDCHARLLLALLTAMGARARLGFLHRGGGPLHVVAQAFDEGAWRWLETTVPGAYGEHPVTAARRKGRLRPDVGGDMLEATMGAIDLQTGHAYLLRLATGAPRDDVARALATSRFRLVSLWQNASELPADWPPSLRDELPSPTRWAIAIYEGEPVCLGLPRDFIEGAEERPPVRVRVTAPSGLYVRSDPSTTGARLGLLSPGEELDVIARGLPATYGAPMGWVQVRAGTIEGFVSAEWIGAVDVAGAKSLETESTPVRWINDGRGGRFTSDMKTYETPRNHNEGSAWWSDRAWDMWLDLADELGVPAEDLLAVSFHESGLYPWITGKDPQTGKHIAWGLFQLTFRWNRAAGISDAQFAEWMAQQYVPQTAEEQIPFMRRYWQAMNATFRKGRGFAGLSPGAFYAYNFVPAWVGDGSDETILVSRIPSDFAGRPDAATRVSYYESNQSLDANRDGRVTIADMTAVVRKRQGEPLFRLALARLNAARARRGQPPSTPPDGGASFPRADRSTSEGGSLMGAVIASVLMVGSALASVGVALALRRRR